MRAKALLALPVVLSSAGSLAQMSIPDAPAPDGARLFRNQCATCHSLKASEPARQGPNLEHVFGRKIGAVNGYAYTPGYREASENWGEDNLDKYLTNPTAMFPGSTMAYRQPKADIRQFIIAYLKGQG